MHLTLGAYSEEIRNLGAIMVFEIRKPTSNSFCEYMVFRNPFDAYDCINLLKNAFPKSCADYLIVCYGGWDNAIEFSCISGRLHFWEKST
jgi:hypothetical protein